MTFPSLLQATEASSASRQRIFFAARGVEFAALTLAAALGAIPNDVFHRAGALAALAFFAAALAVRISGIGDAAEKRWYDARAASESIKSSSWQYAVGGEAFRLSDEAAEARFVDALKDVLKALPKLDVPVGTTGAFAVTPEMKTLRNSSLDERAREYQVQRVNDQLDWYSDKANSNARNATRWRFLLVGTEVAACAVGLTRVLGAFDVDALSVLAAAAAGIAAWAQTKNYSWLSESYSVTSHEVALVASTIAHVADEDTWSQSVHDAEAAFSREHTMWLSRRQGPRP